MRPAIGLFSHLFEKPCLTLTYSNHNTKKGKFKMAIPESNRKAINKYNAKNYDTISVRLPKELVQQFREKCASNSDSQAKIIKEAIEAYLAK